jgi:hypothetical protein
MDLKPPSGPTVSDRGNLFVLRKMAGASAWKSATRWM